MDTARQAEDQDFYLVVATASPLMADRIPLECDNEDDALQIALAVSSPHGHALVQGQRFLARFGPAWGEHLPDQEEIAAF